MGLIHDSKCSILVVDTISICNEETIDIGPDCEILVEIIYGSHKIKIGMDAKANNDSAVNEAPISKGETLEEVRMQRAIALVKLEMQKEVLTNKLSSTFGSRNEVGLLSLFSKNQNARMSTVDYLALGFKMSKWALYLWNLWRSNKK